MNERYECGVCWTVYDPAEGDEVGQIPAGTPFASLPDEWRCPRCDAGRERFLRLSEPPPAGEAVDVETRLDALLASYRRTRDTSIRGLPIDNPHLDVEAVGFHRDGDAWLGVLITSWFMNVVRFPAMLGAWEERDEGEVVERTFPSGTYDFTLSRVAGFGLLETCSLISPMGAFDDPAVVRAVAEAALEEIEREPEPPPQATTRLSRRQLFGRRGHGGERAREP
ncbi:MAG: [NiFe]-hydrogenase assembly chaperone HybE [Myxococcales bacterium]|nr:[NiFe]-hydrogenase assembly chaperone HybE [Myxococcales bacterium]